MEVFCENLDEKGAMVTVVVRDTGIGIPKEKLRDIFDEFAQVESSPNRRYGGTGLGLTISRRLAEMMGGGIDVKSSPSEGSLSIVRRAGARRSRPRR